ncbi:MAG: ABC transporter substrate-binding protein [Burkholderiales bacterium]|nr:ABC transporter substrate-binding protein [Burkholderiales bacterium]
MDRRALIASGACAALAALGGPARAQPARRPARIGWLGIKGSGQAQDAVPLDGLRAGLRERGWIEGGNCIIDAQYGDFTTARDLTLALVQAKADLIVAQGGMIFRAREPAGATPLIFQINGDPVEAGLVASYARPGGTLTGVTNLSQELSAKRVELLKEALPQMSRLAAIANQGHPGWRLEHEATLAATRKLGLALTWLPVYKADEVPAALEAAGASGAQGLVAVPDNLILGQARAIAAFAQARRLPAISGWGEFTEAGNLMSYGPALREVFAMMASYADRILKGARPADLPIENPTRVELVVNRRLAQQLDLRLPPAILVRADRVAG